MQSEPMENVVARSFLLLAVSRIRGANLSIIVKVK